MFLNAYSKGNNRGIDISNGWRHAFLFVSWMSNDLGGVVQIREHNL